MEGGLPGVVQLLEPLIATDAVLGEPCDKILRRLRVLFSDHALVFDGGLPVLLALLLVAALAGHWAENGRRRQNLVEVLELLARTLLVTVRDGPIIDLLDVGEAIDDEGAQEYGVRNFVPLNR